MWTIYFGTFLPRFRREDVRFRAHPSLRICWSEQTFVRPHRFLPEQSIDVAPFAFRGSTRSLFASQDMLQPFFLCLFEFFRRREVFAVRRNQFSAHTRFWDSHDA